MGNFPSDNASLRWHYPNQVMGRSSQLPLSLYCKLPLSSILCSFMSDTMLNVSDGNVKLRIFHRNCAAHLDSAPLHLGRGFLHMRCRDRPQLCNAPRFRFAPSRSWLSPHGKEKERASGNASTSRGSSFFLSALLNCYTQKNRRPRSSNVCKNSDFQVRDQGFEPWTP